MQDEIVVTLTVGGKTRTLRMYRDVILAYHDMSSSCPVARTIEFVAERPEWVLREMIEEAVLDLLREGDRLR